MPQPARLCFRMPPEAAACNWKDSSNKLRYVCRAVL